MMKTNFQLNKDHSMGKLTFGVADFEDPFSYDEALALVESICYYFNIEAEINSELLNNIVEKARKDEAKDIVFNISTSDEIDVELK
jgi:hypothetical protein